ncbi:tryptophan--tRNA ligase [Acidiferrimicrobium sp. IK]|uniref:tryptophan--tRNA ligase n=1 Tax=Acidiferrimicrobium sp. IK TaxID=2871700 RepID=UPI0021CB071A|nr:tryptophan--tRNA ligase [Acidiferrimicrobium sp. IK]
MTRVLSGIQPTGQPQLGNYLGALRSWIALQDSADAFYCVVDLHALTVPGDAAELRSATMTMATLLLAAGLDPDRCTLFVQSHVPAHTQVAWLLECTASFGEMRRMTQWKDKSAKGGEEAARLGLLAYPALMAADIVLYDADRVPVGDDQRQHLELTRTLAERFNHRYGQTFKVPDALIPARGQGGRVMDLQEPTRKMSKSSDSPQGTVFLFDDPKDIERKIKRAVTDADDGPDAVRYDPAAKPGVSNLLDILATITGRTPDQVAAGYTRYGPLKADTASAVVELLAPIQARYRELASDPASVAKVLRAGAERANEVAAATAARAEAAIGLLPPG